MILYDVSCGCHCCLPSLLCTEFPIPGLDKDMKMFLCWSSTSETASHKVAQSVEISKETQMDNEHAGSMMCQSQASYTYLLTCHLSFYVGIAPSEELMISLYVHITENIEPHKVKTFAADAAVIPSAYTLQC